jgi:hypothetical protein
MATLKLFINEQLSLDGDDRSTLQSIDISDINYLDHRTMLLPAGVKTTIFEFNTEVTSGTFREDKLKYARVTNQSTSIPVNIEVSSSKQAFNFRMEPQQSFYLPSSQVTGSLIGFSYDYISSINLRPSGSNNTAKVEFYIATS